MSTVTSMRGFVCRRRGAVQRATTDRPCREGVIRSFGRLWTSDPSEPGLRNRKNPRARARVAGTAPSWIGHCGCGTTLYAGEWLRGAVRRNRAALPVVSPVGRSRRTRLRRPGLRAKHSPSRPGLGSGSYPLPVGLRVVRRLVWPALLDAVRRSWRHWPQAAALRGRALAARRLAPRAHRRTVCVALSQSHVDRQGEGQRPLTGWPQDRAPLRPVRSSHKPIAPSTARQWPSASVWGEGPPLRSMSVFGTRAAPSLRDRPSSVPQITPPSPYPKPATCGQNLQRGYLRLLVGT